MAGTDWEFEDFQDDQPEPSQWWHDEDDALMADFVVRLGGIITPSEYWLLTLGQRVALVEAFNTFSNEQEEG